MTEGTGKAGASWSPQGVDGLTEIIADTAETLSPGHLSAWARVVRRVSGPEDPHLAAKLLGARAGTGMVAVAGRLVQAWTAHPEVSGQALALALVTAGRMSEREASRRSDVVVTGPGSARVPTRLTPAVVAETVRRARQELLVVSFAAYRADEVVRELTDAAARGVRVDVILEDTTKAMSAFTDLTEDVAFWRWPVHSRGAGGKASLHAKLLAADRSTALIGSANLTDRAMNDNIELGVILRDPRVVARVVRHFRFLMGPEGPLLRV